MAVGFTQQEDRCHTLNGMVYLVAVAQIQKCGSLMMTNQEYIKNNNYYKKFVMVVKLKRNVLSTHLKIQSKVIGQVQPQEPDNR